MPAMTYTVISHDAWGSASVGSFTSLEQAREVFQALQNDRWFLADGSVRGLSIVEETAGAAPRTLERFSFPHT
jgi:hypothetical protein